MKLETSALGTISNVWEIEATQAVLARSSLADARRHPTPSFPVRTQPGQHPPAADTGQFISADCLQIAAVQCTIHSVLKYTYSNESQLYPFQSEKL